MVRHRAPLSALAVIPAAFLAVFFVWPVANVLARGVAVGDVLGDAHLRAVAWFTLWQAVVSTALTVVVALPCAWVLARYRFRGRSLVWAVITVPFVLPTVVVASAFVAVLRPYGLVPGLGAVLAAHVYFNVAVVARTVGVALGNLDPHLEESARVLGASRVRAFREVSLPLVRPALVSAASIVFLFTFTSFGVVLLLGGARRATLDVEIWRQVAFFLDLRVASALALVQLVAVVACLAIGARLQRGAVPRAQRDAARRVRGWRERAVVIAILGVTAALLVTPLVVVAYRSVHVGDGLGLAYYRALGSSRRGSTLFVSPARAIGNSLLFGAIATVLALVVGGITAALAAYRRVRWLDLLVMLPLGTSAVTVGLGFLLALDEPPLDLRQWRWLVPVAHALIAAPFVVRIVVPVLRAIDPRVREAAATLGASPRRVLWEVDVPLASRAVLVAAGFAFAVSLGEFGATIFLARPDSPTMPIAIFRFLARPGAVNIGQAMAMSTLLMLVTVAVIGAIERFRIGSAGTF
jgi:thiamine transport system permease protein